MSLWATGSEQLEEVKLRQCTAAHVGLSSLHLIAGEGLGAEPKDHLDIASRWRDCHFADALSFCHY